MMAKTKGKYQTDFKTYEEFEQIFNSIPGKNRLEWAKNLDPNLLRIRTGNGWTVAHALANNRILPEKFVTEELLRIKNKDGRTVAHVLARREALPEKFVTDELLRTKTDYGWTVAHVLADRGTLPEKFVTDELLRMEDKDGRTVVHVLAERGTLPEKFVTEELLRMEGKDGRTVAGCCCIFLSRNNRWDMLTPELLAAPYSKTLSVAAFLRSTLAQMETKDPERLESALGAMTTKTKLALLKGSRGSAAAKKIRGDIDREMESEAFETSPDGEQDLHSEGQEELYCGVQSDR